jgi:hypothetical protein
VGVGYFFLPVLLIILAFTGEFLLTSVFTFCAGAFFARIFGATVFVRLIGDFIRLPLVISEDIPDEKEPYAPRYIIPMWIGGKLYKKYP